MKRQIRHIMAILCIAIAVFMISVPAAAVGEAVDSDIEVSSETAENETSESKAWASCICSRFCSGSRSNCNGYCNRQGVRRNFKAA